MQIGIRRLLVKHRARSIAAIWPIDEEAGRAPVGWRGWPDGKQFAVVLTHDVEGLRGRDKCLALAELEERYGFRSSFNFVAEDYPTSAELRKELVGRGFEVGLHGLSHDGHLYRSRQGFLDQARRINGYLKEWNAVGFRSPAMHHNLEWLCDLDAQYDASTFDTDPFEPYPTGVRTIFPFYVKLVAARPGYVEMPYSLPQDHTLFVMLREKGIAIWRKKLDWIAQKGGMGLLITHPDYMSFNGKELQVDEYTSKRYEEFLEYVSTNYAGRYWHALPKDVARYCFPKVAP